MRDIIKLKYIIYYAVALASLRVAGEVSSIILPNYAVSQLTAGVTIYSFENFLTLFSLALLTLMFMRPKWILGCLLYMLTLILKLIFYSYSAPLMESISIGEVAYVRMVGVLTAIIWLCSALIFYSFLRGKIYGEKGLAFWVMRRIGKGNVLPE